MLSSAISAQVQLCCSCPSNPPATFAYAKATAVFTGKVLHVEVVRNGFGQRAMLMVHEAFKGVHTGQQVVIEQTPYCEPEFAVDGRQWLFYLDQYSHTSYWFAAGCFGRTAPVDQAVDDLRYLRAPTRQLQNRLSGRVMRWDPKEGWRPVAGERVNAVLAGREFSTVTADDGVYEIYGVPKTGGLYPLVLLAKDFGGEWEVHATQRRIRDTDEQIFRRAGMLPPGPTPEGTEADFSIWKKSSPPAWEWRFQAKTHGYVEDVMERAHKQAWRRLAASLR
jgi:hypothetical protein